MTDIVDNRAMGVACYNPEYTLVEKLHAISRKFRQQQADGSMPQNFMRHYYDVYCLLAHDTVLAFLGSENYKAHKAAKFTQNDEHDLRENEAFLLAAKETRKLYQDAYESTRALYYQDMPSFDAILERIAAYAERL